MEIEDQSFDEKSLLLTKHGIKVFGSKLSFDEWMHKPNFHFEKKAPIEFINTNQGITFIDSRLTGIEYGDNA